MAFSYDPQLQEDLYWVRFMVGDRVREVAVLADEEINAFLAD